jgi:hypothetical protein
MGFGEVIGNQSVHWQVDQQGPPLTVNTNNPNRPPKTPGPNPAHVLNVAAARARGRDPKPITAVGHGTGSFQVRLRFETQAEAQAAVQQAVANPVSTAGGYYVVIPVKAIERNDPEDAPAAEVRVEW